MSYKVIARKYRPQTFSEIVGQQHVTKTLANAIESNRVAHAYIFSGVRGVGKTTAARILAKALNCASGPTINPDNTCDSCREISTGTSLDVLEIDAASNRGIDQIRELREMVRYAPASSRYKVVILDEAHQLTDEASNALLKTLEEPPERVVFILATTRAEDLVETIKSRAQLFQFRSLTFQEIAGEIERIAKSESLRIDSGAVAVLARAAEGSMRDGLSLLEQAIAYAGETITDAQVRELLGVVAESVLDSLVEAIAAQSAERALGLVHRLIGDGQNLQHFCREAIRHFRNLLIVRVCGADSNLVAAPQDERPRLAEQAAQFGEEDLTRFFNILLATDDDLRRKPDPRLHLELGLLRLINAQRLAPLEEALAELHGESRPRPVRQESIAPPRATPATQAVSSSSSSSVSSSSSAAAVRMAPVAAPPEPIRAAPAVSPTSALPAIRSATPVPATPPRVVARVAGEIATNGLASAQVDAIKAALQGQRFLWSMVEHATRWEIDGGELRLFFPTESRALAEMLQARDPMERLRTVLNQVVGQPLRVCVKLDSTRAANRDSELQARFEQDPIVRTMLEKFGGRISQVRRPGEG
ncbi:MAG TPA: DNA polymerase III subunit gamma/tau [Candidatus Acidoferrales bacterium]|jgi:DNA polymerase-3 subunit gamma/tau|nr:DNA polymerase III subunit gamma/tau [Candidatus Acidoferrales bacterium]